MNDVIVFQELQRKLNVAQKEVRKSDEMRVIAQMLINDALQVRV